jgi:hypothetical protein
MRVDSGCLIQASLFYCLLYYGWRFAPAFGLPRIAGLGLGFLAFVVVMTIYLVALEIVERKRRGSKKEVREQDWRSQGE